MIKSCTTRRSGHCPRGSTLMLCAMVACALLAGGLRLASAQQPQAAPAPMEAPAAAPQLAPDHAQPNLLDALGRWLGDSKSRIDEQLKNTQDALGELGTQATTAARDAVGAAQQATGLVIGLPGARIVNGRERCPLAANGAPDCISAANALCRNKGFAAGRGLDVNAAQKCPAWVRWSGRAPAAGECATETFVVRAVCQ